MLIRCFKLVVLGVVLSTTIAGCGLSSDPKRMMAKAQEHREKSNYKAAIIELKNVLQKDSGNAEARYLLGVTYFDNQDFRLAEQELRRALDLSYERSKVMPMLGKSMLMLGEFQKVIDQVPLETHASNTVQAEILTLRARALSGLGRASQASELLTAALGKHPDYPDALLEQARLAVRNQNRAEAGQLIERAIVVAPKHIDAWLMKGDLARLNADAEGAIAANQKVLEIAPDNVPARLNIALLHIVSGKLEEARKFISQARVLAPGNLVALHQQALVEYRARNYKAANDTIQQVLKGAPDYVPSVFLAGVIATELGSFEQAQSHLGRVLAQAPENLHARKAMITTLMRSGQHAQAIELLQAGLKQAPQDRQLVALAGELYLQNGEFAKATEYFDLAARQDPKDASARTRVGIVRMATGDWDKAFADLESAVQIDGTKYMADLVLAVSHLRRGNYDQAIKAVESLEKKQANNPVTYNLKGLIYLTKKDITRARENFVKAIELRPTYLAAAVNLAQLDLQDKNPKSARARLEAMLAKDKNYAPALIALAELGPALGATPSEQLDWLERARKGNPQSTQPLVMLTNRYIQMGDARKALEVAQQAQAGNPDNPQLLEVLGGMQLNMGQYEQALTTFRKLVKLQPKSPAALMRLSGAQMATGDRPAASESLRQALVLRPDFLDAHIAMVGLELGAGNFQGAMEIARRVQKQNPKSPIGYALEGDVFMAEKKFAQAIPPYEAVHNLAKSSVSIIKLHLAYMLAGKAGEADARLAQWLKETPGDASVRLYAGESHMRRGQYKEAIVHYESLVELQPKNVLYLNNLAWAYNRAKDGRALETAERAYKLAPDTAAVVDTLGWFLVEQGAYPRGIGLLEQAAKIAPLIPDIRFHLAQAWVKSGDKVKAKAELERALAIKQNFASRAEAEKLLKELGG